MDILTLGVGLISFIGFLLVHLITFRWLRPEQLLRSLVMIMIAVAGLPLILMGALFMCRCADASLTTWVCSTVLAILIEGLMCLVYVLCIFGPYETSVRMRLIREIARGSSAGISMEELLARYNHETIVNVRLRRLVGSGDIIEKDGFYHSGHKKNFFFIFMAIAQVIKKWIDR